MLWALVAAVSAGLLLFSQTLAFYGDEGYHLMAAKYINAGRKPYLDFHYPQTPLYAYLNAGWMRLFGDSWRSAHALSALLTGGSLLLVAGFVFTRVREPEWQAVTAMIATLLTGLHVVVIQFGTIGQPYGLCLFLIIAAFRLAVETVDRDKWWLPAGAGLCAGAAAASSLLAAPVAPIVFVWMVRHPAITNKRTQCARFLAGAIAPFLPVLWLAAQAPRRALFNIVEYHLLYRRSSLMEAMWWDLHTVYRFWIGSVQGLLPALLAIVGLMFLAGRADWGERRRAEFYLCGWLVAGQGLYLANTLPSFEQYFIFLIPFLSILAAVGVWAIGSQIGGTRRPALLMALIVGLFVAGLARPASQMFTGFDENTSWSYYEYEAVAREVNQVTPRDGLIWAEDEFIYIAARRLPPPGMESTRHFESLPSALASALPIVPFSQECEWLRTGRFDTIVLELEEAEDPIAKTLGLSRLYAGHKQLNNYALYWDRVPTETGNQTLAERSQGATACSELIRLRTNFR
jgi:4-amino-4-deoxy-L-arabinose transferase-like glycosyltransferase